MLVKNVYFIKEGQDFKIKRKRKLERKKEAKEETWKIRSTG